MRDRIAAALKQAMLSQDKRATSTLRLISAAIKDRDIAQQSEGKDPVDDDGITAILLKMIRQRIESIQHYEDGHRLDLADQERQEIAIIKAFLPEQMDETQMQKVCVEAIRTTGAAGLRDVGKCMQALKSRYAGRMDFGKASTLVKGMLS
jgi:uncharacterized protein YqeY